MGEPDDPMDAAGSDGSPLGFADPEMLRAPQGTYRMLRDNAPVMEVDMGPMSATLVSRHEDVVTVLRTPEVFSSGVEAVQIGQVRPLIPLQIDPPDHAKYR